MHSLSLSLSHVLIEHSGITGGTDYQRKSSITNVPFAVNRVILYSAHGGGGQAPRAARVRSFLIVIHTWTDRGRHITCHVRVNRKTEFCSRVLNAQFIDTPIANELLRVSSDCNESSVSIRLAVRPGQVNLFLLLAYAINRGV